MPFENLQGLVLTCVLTSVLQTWRVRDSQGDRIKHHLTQVLGTVRPHKLSSISADFIFGMCNVDISRSVGVA